MTRTILQSHPIHSDSSPETDTYTIDIINLNNLLTRLEQNIFLSSSAEHRLLQQSHFQCARIGANIDYAQTLIKKIERSLPSVKAPAIRHERTTDLAKKRGRYEKIKERFDWIKEDVERRVDREEGDVYQEEDNDDDIWEGLRPVEKGAATGTETELEPEVSNNIISSEETTILRQRRHDKTLSPTTTPSTTAAIASGTSTSPLPKLTPTTTDHNKETTLSTHRAEQESLTTSLLTLASQLKASSESFQTSLENEKGILNRAVEGLDRNMTGMEAAGKRMGVLRRMSEGRGWWGRIMMYAWIFGLWIVALGIVYLGPKLRF
ncbi:conserved hypothetical protein [Talaromyces stipitatus ATCC 10500]|uniref:Synaptobrevin n=1 Tax=Talaromyces stipitatus (strain ATCC 10500 / CBS 375.48 / QM 6759 / NRRL 1006) TaxID=441959 RepID=B8M274_TALSN|nr:uncharacterized protein TSTA_087740 [Talaromyces stipitatus ATCC 10500]EED21538.1 conserved hypothetical protein [Talaromyces stipitatus ATCC 10500]